MEPEEAVIEKEEKWPRSVHSLNLYMFGYVDISIVRKFIKLLKEWLRSLRKRGSIDGWAYIKLDKDECHEIVSECASIQMTKSVKWRVKEILRELDNFFAVRKYVLDDFVIEAFEKLDKEMLKNNEFVYIIINPWFRHIHIFYLRIKEKRA